MISRAGTRRIRAIALPLVSCLAAIAVPAEAQLMRGTVADSTSRRPVVGVVVSLLDSAGAAIGRTLTDTGGAFRLRLTPAVRRVRAQRIGFRPLEVALPRDPSVVSLSLARIPTLLEARHVVADACGPARSDGAGTISLVEQARAGLLAMTVARREHPADVSVLTYERSLDGPANVTSVMLVSEIRNSRAGSTFGAAASASDFVTRGFRGIGPDVGTFFAPDADVLLDDAFATSYCFRRARPARDRPNQVGLSFAAARAQRGRVDVDGTLWIDTIARELREIEFRYVGLSAQEERFGPGGRIHFRTMANGIVFVDRWALLLVGATEDPVGNRAAAIQPGTQVRRFRHETGGELATATWPDGTEWRGALGVVRFLARRSDGSVGADLVLDLDHTPFLARTGADGRATITGLPPGPYTVVSRDPALEPVRLKLSTFTRFTSARDTAQVEVEVPTLAEFAALQCALVNRAPRALDKVALLGRVFTADGTPGAGVRYTIRRSSMRGTTSARMEVLIQNGMTGTDGVIPQCRGLTLGSEVEIEIEGAAGQPVRTRIVLGAPFTVLPILRP